MIDWRRQIQHIQITVVIIVVLCLTGSVLFLSHSNKDVIRRLEAVSDSLALLRRDLETVSVWVDPQRWQIDSSGLFRFCGRDYRLDNWFFRERLQDQLWFLYNRRGWLYLQYQRLGRYRPMIEAELAAHKLPPDLVYLFVWESGLDPKAVSSAGATGLAQFIKSAAREFKVKVGDLYDERKNPHEAIKAAVRYLKKYYSYFNDWLLTLAAYNYGPSSVQASLLEQGVDNVLALELPSETYHYIFQVMALKYIFDGGLLGNLSWLKQHQPLPAFVRQTIRLTRPLSLSELARQRGVDIYTLRLLNPHLPPKLINGQYPINLPDTADQ